VAGTRIKNGGLRNTSSGYTVGTEGYTRKPGRPRKTWMDIVRRDLNLKDMGTSWDEAEELATNRAEWRQRVAQCIHLDVR